MVAVQSLVQRAKKRGRDENRPHLNRPNPAFGRTPRDSHVTRKVEKIHMLRLCFCIDTLFIFHNGAPKTLAYSWHPPTAGNACILWSDVMSGRASALRTISAAMLVAFMVAPAFAVDVPPLDDFDFEITGQGQPGQWSVVRDLTALDGIAIEQSNTDPTENRFPLAIYKSLSLKSLAASVHLKLIKGRMQTAGIAFRFVNADNYYVVSASALEERIDLFRVLGGRMERIGGAEADVALNHGHKLGVVAEADQFKVSLRNAWLFTVWDRTFLTDGRVGLWTEEDNVTRFDQFEIKALPWSEDP